MSKHASILVIGRTGQLAKALAEQARPSRSVYLVGRPDFDLGTDDVARLFDFWSPAAVVNAAAYNAVDAAETEPETAFRVNASGPAQLAAACAAAAVPFIHVSTDYVFDGRKGSPYREGDLPAPLGAYGRSKRAGEEAVLAVGGSSAVVRTSWVFSATSSNFLGHMLKMLDGPDQANVVADQQARPTWASDLASALLKLLEHLRAGEPEARGVFHYAGATDATRVAMAELIFEWASRRGHRTPEIRGVATSAFNAFAPRPLDTRLENLRLTRLGIPSFDWRPQLLACLDQRARQAPPKD